MLIKAWANVSSSCIVECKGHLTVMLNSLRVNNPEMFLQDIQFSGVVLLLLKEMFLVLKLDYLLSAHGYEA